jgi:hypothetical protein
MPKRSRKPVENTNQTAFRVVQDSLRKLEPELAAKKPKAKRKNPAAVALGRKGGKVGGKRRAANMTAKERSEASRKAAQARWANNR